MSKVILIKKHFLENLGRQASQLTQNWGQGSRVAVKAHMGEYGNLFHTRPQIVGRVVEELKKNGLKPFVYDTVVKYPGSRDTKEKYLETAKKNGFCPQTIGCPIIISGRVYKLKTLKLEIGVADVLRGVRYHVVISHAKGHVAAGFGGAIKNMGMGCVGAETKAMLHEKTKVKLVGNCTKCGQCVAICPKQAIVVDERGWQVDYQACWGCGYCLDECPEKALAPLEDSLTYFLAEASVPIIHGRISLYVNVAMDITARCDCMSNAGQPACSNIGIFVSTDPVAIDLATIDAIKKEVPDFFSRIVKIDPSGQIKTAEELGLGQARYELVGIENN